MLRVVPLIAVLVICACSRNSAQASSTAAETPAAAQTAEAAKPVPAQLPDVLARVNGESIDKAEFEKQLQQIESRAGGPVPADQRDTVYRGLLDQLIGYRLLTQESQARKVSVPDADVESRISEIRSQFPSEEVFTKLLAQQQLTIEQLRADARRDMAVAKMIEDEIAAKVAVNADQVDAFYKENPDQFKQGERVRASHILIAFPQDADTAAKAQARTKAEQVLTDVKGGGDFAALAKQHSQDPGSAVQGGDLGYFSAGEMVGPFSDTAFSLPPGTTSELVETQYGFHIIRVMDKQAARTIPLDEIRPQVEQYLSERNRQEQTEAFVNTLKMKGKVEIFI